MNGTICYIGVGSNLENPLEQCRRAIQKISEIEGITITAQSSFYKTEPVDFENQNDFINAVLEIKTSLEAQQLLNVLQNIERSMGRRRELKGGPRTIDLDILFYGQSVIQEDNLIIPHPQVHMRRFVLEPMSEIASYFIHPAFGVTIRGLKDRLTDSKAVEKIKGCPS